MKQLTSVVLVLLLSPLAAWASTAGYVYVASPAVACPHASPCAPPQLVVFDGGTLQTVVTIDLPVHTVPSGLAISRNGDHLYVSNRGAEFGAATSLSVIDARRHTLTATYPLLPNQAGELAVRADDSLVYIMGRTESSAFEPQVHAFNTNTHAVVASSAINAGVSTGALSYSHATDRVYVLMDGGFGASGLTAYEATSLTAVASAHFGQASHTGLGVSADGLQLFANHYISSFPLSRSHAVTIVDASSLSTVTATGASYNLLNMDAVEVPGTGDALFAMSALSGSDPETSTLERFARASGTRAPPIRLNGTISAIAASPQPGRAVVLTVPNLAPAVQRRRLVAIDTVSGAIASERVIAHAGSMTSTPAGAQSCSYRLDSSYASFNSAQTVDVPIRLATDCAWMTTTDQPWVHVDRTSGTGNATITISADVNLTGQTRRATVTIGGQIVTVTQGSPQDATPAFGVIDTPGEGANVSGTIAITGWALDDLAVQTVFIYRDPVAGEPQTQIPIGTATLVEGARPDVQAAYPSFPFASRAGWGYMLLTNMLPASADGSYRIHVYVADLDRHSTYLGSRTIHVNNAASTLPFGAIDTPGQGEVVSGVIINWGWALTPQPANIPTDGSTIDVVIDGVVVGRPTYGFNRADIAALFPGYANTNSAVGYFTIDTRTLANGVHTIAWVVRDSLGRAQGIGSRYFTVQNP